MRTIKSIFVFLLLTLPLSRASFAQQLSTTSAPVASPSAVANAVGVTGASSWYYVVVGNYPAGSTQSAVVSVNNGNATLNSSNYNIVGWTALPGVLTYDVLRLPAAANGVFTGSCTCSVTTGLAPTVTGFADQGGSVSAYTITAGASQGTAIIYADVLRYAFPKLRVQLNTGNTIADHLAEIASGSTLPSYAVPGDIFVRTGSTQPGIYYSSTANAYTFSGVTAQDCGSTTTCAATNTSSSYKVVRGTAALSTGSPSTAAVTGISPAFTSATSYTCVAQDATTIANNIGVLTAGYVSGSAVTFTGPNTVTDAFRYVCTGF